MTTLTLTPNNDKKTGTAAADSINGLAGNDTLSGLSGNDTLSGGTGADSLDGGTDNDRLSGDTGNDTLLGSAGNDSLDGGADNDKLDGGAGADTLEGGTGADAMSGGDGNDLYFVDNIGDKLTETAKSTGGIDTVKSSITYILPANVEHLELTGLANLNGTGNALANKITGNDGNNLLDGGNGFDTLIGGAGDDTLIGGLGADTLIGGDGSDTYQINSLEDRILETEKDGDQDAVESSISYVLDTFLEVLTLTGTRPIDGTGNTLANTLEGNDADNTLKGEKGHDTLLGNGGDDTLGGGAGDDVIDGGDGNDTVNYTGNKDGYRIVLEDSSQTWIVEDIDRRDGDEGSDRLSNIETLAFADGDYQPGTPTLSLSDVSLSEGQVGSRNAVFVFTLSGPAQIDVTLDYATVADTAEAGSDYQLAQGSLTIPKGQTSTKLPVSILGDTQLEPDESFRLVLSNVQGAELDTTEASAILLNDDLPSLSIQGITVPEGNTGSSRALLTVQLSEPVKQTVSVQYASSPTGTATANEDYTPVSGTLTFAPGEISKTIAIDLQGDTQLEKDESFRVQLTRPQNAQLDTTAGSASVVISNDDQISLTLSSNPASTFKAGQTVALTFSFSDLPKGFQASDIQVTGGTLAALQPDATGKTWTASLIPVSNIDKLTATVGVLVGSYTDAYGQPGQVSNVLTLNGDTLPPSVTLSSDTTGLKTGETARISVNFSEIPTGFTADDLRVSTGSLSPLIAAGDGKTWTAVYTPPVNASQTTSLSLPANSYTDTGGNGGLASNTLNLSIETLQPTLSIASVTASEGNDSTGTVSVTVSLSAASSLPVTVYYGTSNGTAIAGMDYTQSSGQLTFQPGQTRQTLQIPILGDTTVEPDETFQVQLSGASNAILGNTTNTATVTLSNDDQAYMSVSDASITEGNTGTRKASVTVTLSNPSSQKISVHYATQDGTAQAGSDYTALSGTLNFAPGETSKILQIPVIGDTTQENDETFMVQLSAASNALLNSAASAASAATVTILNDDNPVVFISNTTQAEGSTDGGNATVTVTLSNSSRQTVSVNYATRDGSARAGSDYTAVSQVLSFAPDETSKTIAIPVVGDTLIEPDETFTINLSTPVNATLSSITSATVTLTNDDTLLPALTLGSDKTTLKAGEVATLSFSFNVIPSGFTSSDIQLTGGTLGNLTADVSGKIYTARFTPTALDTWAGSVSVAARSYTDSAGNPGNASNTLSLSGDTLAPTLTATTPADNASGVAVSSNLVLNFSEAVQAGTGNIVISNGSDTRTLSITDTSQVSFSGNSVILNPATDLQDSSNYFVQLASGVLRDTAGNGYAGITDAGTFNFVTDISASTASSARITLGGTYQGTIEQAGDVDWVGITLTGGSAYEFDLYGADSSSGTLEDPHIQGIYDTSGRFQTNTGGVDTSGTLDDTVSFQPTVTGIYYIACTGYDTTTGTYALTAQIADPFYGV